MNYFVLLYGDLGVNIRTCHLKFGIQHLVELFHKNFIHLSRRMTSVGKGGVEICEFPLHGIVDYPSLPSFTSSTSQTREVHVHSLANNTKRTAMYLCNKA